MANQDNITIALKSEASRKRRRALCLLAAALALGGAAHANIISDRDPWILVGLNWGNSVGLEERDDVAADAEMDHEPPGVMPMYATRGECFAAERRILLKYKGVSHAAGGNGYYLCTPLSAWAIPQ